MPFCVFNDGDVTALAGAISLEDTNILGIAMGTSEAGGYVDENGYIKPVKMTFEGVLPSPFDSTK